MVLGLRIFDHNARGRVPCFFNSGPKANFSFGLT
jgi:hypothetical protein